MPIYEYQCPKCQKIFEEWVKVSESHGQEPCPECGAMSPRLISHTSFVLKGGGWYVTDYGYRKGVKDEDSASSGSSPASSSATGSEGKGESGSGDSSASGATSGAKTKKDSASASKPAKKSAKPGKSGGKGKTS